MKKKKKQKKKIRIKKMNLKKRRIGKTNRSKKKREKFKIKRNINTENPKQEKKKSNKENNKKNDKKVNKFVIDTNALYIYIGNDKLKQYGKEPSRKDIDRDKLISVLTESESKVYIPAPMVMEMITGFMFISEDKSYVLKAIQELMTFVNTNMTIIEAEGLFELPSNYQQKLKSKSYDVLNEVLNKKIDSESVFINAIIFTLVAAYLGAFMKDLNFDDNNTKEFLVKRNEQIDTIYVSHPTEISSKLRKGYETEDPKGEAKIIFDEELLEFTIANLELMKNISNGKFIEKIEDEIQRIQKENNTATGVLFKKFTKDRQRKKINRNSSELEDALMTSLKLNGYNDSQLEFIMNFITKMINQKAKLDKNNIEDLTLLFFAGTDKDNKVISFENAIINVLPEKNRKLILSLIKDKEDEEHRDDKDDKEDSK